MNLNSSDGMYDRFSKVANNIRQDATNFVQGKPIGSGMSAESSDPARKSRINSSLLPPPLFLNAKGSAPKQIANGVFGGSLLLLAPLGATYAGGYAATTLLLNTGVLTSLKNSIVNTLNSHSTKSEAKRAESEAKGVEPEAKGVGPEAKSVEPEARKSNLGASSDSAARIEKSNLAALAEAEKLNPSLDLAVARRKLQEARQALKDHAPMSEEYTKRTSSRKEKAEIANLELKVQQAEQEVIDLVKKAKGQEVYIPGAKFKEKVEVIQYEKIGGNELRNTGIKALKGDALKTAVAPSPLFKKVSINKLKNKEDININHLDSAAQELIRRALKENEGKFIETKEKALPRFFHYSVTMAFFEAKNIKPDEKGNYDLSGIKKNVVKMMEEKHQVKTTVYKKSIKKYETSKKMVLEVEKKLTNNSDDPDLKKELINLKAKKVEHYKEMIGIQGFLQTYDQLTPVIDTLFANGDFQQIAQKYLSGKVNT